jgi:GntR family transcriptional regulator
MFVSAGAPTLLLQGERQKFLAEEWPRICAAIQRLGLKAEELLHEATRRTKPNAKKDGR